jgi:hypothetical protein
VEPKRGRSRQSSLTRHHHLVFFACQSVGRCSVGNVDSKARAGWAGIWQAGARFTRRGTSDLHVQGAFHQRAPCLHTIKRVVREWDRSTSRLLLLQSLSSGDSERCSREARRQIAAKFQFWPAQPLRNNNIGTGNLLWQFLNLDDLTS